MIPAHCGALEPFKKVHALTSLGPAVKYVSSPRREYPAFIILVNPVSSKPSADKNSCCSSWVSNCATSDSIAAEMMTALAFSVLAFWKTV